MKRKTLDFVYILESVVRLFTRNEVGDDVRKEIGLHPKLWERFLNLNEPVFTVNVIETVDGRIIGMKSWLETHDGNESAEAHFKWVMKEHTKGVHEWDDDVLAATVEDGTYDDDMGYRLVITHSV